MTFFLYGQDTYRSRQKLHELEEKFLHDVDPSGVNLLRLDGGAMTIDDVHVAVATQSMFAKKRMIVIEGLLGKGKKDVQEAVAIMLSEKQFPDDHIVVFWEPELGKSKATSRKSKGKKKSSFAKASEDAATHSLLDVLRRQKYVQEFRMLTPLEAQQWCEQEIRRNGGNIERAAVQLLVALTGGDLWRLSHEIKKLLAYARGAQSALPESEVQHPITKSMVEELVHAEFESNIFALTDALALRSKEQALGCLHQELASGTPPLYVLSMIVRQYRILLEVADAIHASVPLRQLPEVLAIHPFVLEKARTQVTHYTFPELKNIYRKLLSIDVDMKTTRTDPELLLDRFIVEL